MVTRYSARKGFTLVEILIVVIILGILAAIVIPQFTNASQDARRSSLKSTVQSVRSQIELYKLQHGDQLPDICHELDPLTTVTTYNGKNFGPYMHTAPKNGMTDTSDRGERRRHRRRRRDRGVRLRLQRRHRHRPVLGRREGCRRHAQHPIGD